MSELVCNNDPPQGLEMQFLIDVNVNRQNG